MQPRNYQDLEDLFRDELRDASFLPPVGVWDKIEAQLPVRKPFLAKYAWHMAATLLVALVVTALLIREMVPEVPGKLAERQTAVLQSTNEKHKNDVSKLTDIHQNNTAKAAISSTSTSADKSTGSLGTSKIVETDKRQASNGNDIQCPANAANKGVSKSDKIAHATFMASMSKRASGAQLRDLKKSVQGNEAKAVQEELIEVPVASIRPLVAFDPDYNPEAMPTRPFTYEEDMNNYQPIGQIAHQAGVKRHSINTNQGFFMGPSFGYQFNRLTMQPSSPETDISFMEYRFHGGVHYGLSFGYDFPSRWGIMAEWVYSSFEGQRFKEDFGDYSVDKSIELDYMKFPVMLRYQMAFQPERLNKPVIVNLIGGAHISLLRSRNTYVNGELAYFDQKYNKRQWGLMAGAELDLHATQRLFFTVGARGGFAATTEAFPRIKGKEGNDPMSFNVGLYARLNYRFVK